MVESNEEETASTNGGFARAALFGKTSTQTPLASTSTSFPRNETTNKLKRIQKSNKKDSSTKGDSAKKREVRVFILVSLLYAKFSYYFINLTSCLS